jgi:fermentation-respiration switch protein FrsA (DUF1100 family)
MKRVALTFLAVVVVSYLSLCALLFTQQRRLIFPAPQRVPLPLGPSVILQVPGGTELLWHDAGGSGPVVVHFHGNGEQISNEVWLADALASRGVSLAAVEYPGYAGLPGTPTEASLLAAAEAALTHLTGPMGIARERLVLSGQSVGTGVAVAMAAKGWGTRLLLLTPYTTLPDVAARTFRWLPVRLLMRDTFDSASRAPDVKVPVLILHGTADEVIPVELGERLSKAFPKAYFVPIPGGHHNDLWDSLQVATAVLDFVSSR